MKGLLVLAGAICVAVFLFTVSLDSKTEPPSTPTGTAAPTDTSGAASSGPVAFPSSGSKRTKGIWQDPLGASLIVAGVVVGAVVFVRERRRQPDTAD